MMMKYFAVLMVASQCLIRSIQGFAPPPTQKIGGFPFQGCDSHTALDANKKKRKRKQAPGQQKAPSSSNAGSSPPPKVGSAPPVVPTDLSDAGAVKQQDLTAEDIDVMKDIANFEFKPDDAIAFGVADDEVKDEDGNSFKLPDIKDALRKRELEEEMARLEAEDLASKPKIKRSDTKAFKKLLQSNPFGDADDALFEEEKYGIVSALLGERAAPFLGIPTGPIQVGHFIGALGIMLMAFVEYPGFPLTNLPTPIRGCLQGGLATTYVINVVLAGTSIFKASERDQPVLLWVAKTFAVGGLAFDQLTQLPTLEEIEAAKNQKGKRR